jgi:hypothetical protein
MIVYGHASMLSGLGGDAESQQLRCGEAYGSPAQYRAALGLLYVPPSNKNNPLLMRRSSNGQVSHTRPVCQGRSQFRERQCSSIPPTIDAFHRSCHLLVWLFQQ